jgi:hypothetical protein
MAFLLFKKLVIIVYQLPLALARGAYQLPLALARGN